MLVLPKTIKKPSLTWGGGGGGGTQNTFGTDFLPTIF